MKMLGALASAAPVAVLAAGPAATATVNDRASCARAVRETKLVRDTAAVPDKLGRELDEMLAIAGRLCADGHFTYAERLLSIARGMVSGQ